MHLFTLHFILFLILGTSWLPFGQHYQYTLSRRPWKPGTAAPKSPRSRMFTTKETSTATSDGGGEASIPLKFMLRGRDLMKKDRNGASDPYVVVTCTQDNVTDEISVGKTGVALDTANPSWPDVFNVTYVPTAHQKIHFSLWDKDFGQDDQVGRAWVFLGDYFHNGEYAQRYLNPGFLIMEKAQIWDQMRDPGFRK